MVTEDSRLFSAPVFFSSGTMMMNSIGNLETVMKSNMTLYQSNPMEEIRKNIALVDESV